MSKINLLISEMTKKYGDKVFGYAKDLKETKITRTESGSSFLDWALGGGFPLGRVVELYGPYSSGKSLISLLTIAEAQKKGMTCVYIDVEKAFDKDFAKLLGVDTDNLIVTRESVAERVMDMACDIAQSGKVAVIVIDSVASMVPLTELNESLEKATMAELARVMSKGIRKLNHLNKNALVIFINQLREKPGVSYGNPEYRPGGKALGFFNSLALDVRRGDWILDKKKKIGQVVKFKVTKNKTGPNYRDGYFNFLYDKGIDRVDELVSLALLEDKIMKKGAYFYLDEETGFQGREKLEDALRSDKELFKKLKEKVNDKQ